MLEIKLPRIFNNKVNNSPLMTKRVLVVMIISNNITGGATYSLKQLFPFRLPADLWGTSRQFVLIQ